MVQSDLEDKLVAVFADAQAAQIQVACFVDRFTGVDQASVAVIVAGRVAVVDKQGCRVCSQGGRQQCGKGKQTQVHRWREWVGGSRRCHAASHSLPQAGLRVNAHPPGRPVVRRRLCAGGCAKA